jgi:predicted nucleic acid-binding protein
VKEGNIKFVTSQLSIIELYRKILDFGKVENPSSYEINKLVSDFRERIAKQNKNFLFIEVDANMIEKSISLMAYYDISPNDAFHIYTCLAQECGCFIIDDPETASKINPTKLTDTLVCDLNDEKMCSNLITLMDL